MTTDYKLSFIKKHLVRVINKNYDSSVKEILSEPTRRNPHTTVSSSIHLSSTTGGNKTLSTQLYSARLTRQKERKDSKDMQGYLDCGLLHLQEALLNARPYIRFLLIAALVH